MTLAFTFRPTAAEHSRVLMLMLRRKRGYWVSIGVLILIIMALAVIPARQGRSVTEVASTVLPYLLVFGAIFLALPLVQRWQLGRFYRQTPTWQEEQTHEFSEDGLRMRNPLSNTLMRWDALVDVLETKEFFLFFISRSMAYFLPKRAITTPDQLRELRGLLETQLSRAGRTARVLAA
jgi:hypothetical protein